MVRVMVRNRVRIRVRLRVKLRLAILWSPLRALLHQAPLALLLNSQFVICDKLTI